ncbi:hypothetical protein [Saccharicrinis aurantiacus]|uniref:hypothetical protein n=1 Tax=Saccharicrinis aurantiacus TaxID=1849719 RepID=UPI00248F5802|nr:hypothetical protein [Saccharicrinis aurantiacus]
MKNSRLICLLIIGIGFSINSYCKKNNPLNTASIDSVKFDFNFHTHKTMGLSMSIVSNWKVIEDKANTPLIIANQNKKSFLKISLSEMSDIRESMKSSTEQKGKYNLDDDTKKELLQKLVVLNSDIQDRLNSEMNITNTTASKHNKDCFMSMTYKTINKKGYLIEATGFMCEEEIKFMIESLKSSE